MTIRYNCPRSSYTGAYVLLDTHTRTGAGYYQDGQIRWDVRSIMEIEERKNVKDHTWVPVASDQLLPKGF